MHPHTWTLAVVVVFGIIGPQSVRSEISGLAVTSAKDIGPFRGKTYRGSSKVAGRSLMLST
jgi:hypothetical protein